jgi:hypothetical protein
MALLTPLWAQRASSMSLYSFPPPTYAGGEAGKGTSALHSIQTPPQLTAAPFGHASPPPPRRRRAFLLSYLVTRKEERGHFVAVPLYPT